ncbi:MAG: beta-N-acetylhexosaminidase [Prolixibacteraceae bacterium]|jgi:hexosaminidase|nr:beta-N-acetylhexosaminidase [Prolixibacteraceae bacterium]
MKRVIIFFSILSASIIAMAHGNFPVIPYPNKLVEVDGQFEFKSALTVTLPKAFKSELGVVTSIFADEYSVKILSAPNGKLSFRQNKQLGNEAYKLTVGSDKMEVEASTTTGCFWAVQTIRQLMKLTGSGGYTVAGCQIEDQPAYQWRAFMLDDVRHFKGKKVVKGLLDQMALLKLNIFHWHLTDDQGWRIEIKKYPLLTEVGAWRDSTQIYPPVGPTRRYNPYAHGGFYSQEDVKEIIEYAANLHITIVPEIEMPGHALAAIAAYPWLGSDGEKIKVPCNFGRNDKVNAFNVADERVYRFLEEVLKEVMALFPGKVIHIGGDEVDYAAWKNNEAVNALMKKEGFKNYSDVQIYFTNRISNFIEKSGKRMMGWNEIVGNVNVDKQEELATTSLAKSSIIHFWKGSPKLLNEAISKGYDVVNSNKIYTYLDYNYEATPLEKAYSFSPLPEGIKAEQAKQVLGLGCQMWGERIPKVTEMYYQVFPRIAAYAEDGWTNDINKNFDHFSKALGKLKHYWNSKGIIYYDEN